MSFANGRCACGAVQYTLRAAPLIVHACHCRDCQRNTGAAFAVNLWIEGDRLELSGALFVQRLPSGEGKGQDLHRCAQCGVAIFTRYLATPGDMVFVRAGTLEDPGVIEPDVHIFTRSKVPWLQLPDGARAFETFYDLKSTWPAASLERFHANRQAHPPAQDERSGS